MIRPARPEDAQRLREIAAAAKGHWGYDEELVRSWAATIELEDELEVAEEDGAIVSWSALLRGADGVHVLEDLWVAPPWTRRGIGSELFRRAVTRARARGASALELVRIPTRSASTRRSVRASSASSSASGAA